MTDEKKEWVNPSLTVIGLVSDLTQQKAAGSNDGCGLGQGNAGGYNHCSN